MRHIRNTTVVEIYRIRTFKKANIFGETRSPHKVRSLISSKDKLRRRTLRGFSITANIPKLKQFELRHVNNKAFTMSFFYSILSL